MGFGIGGKLMETSVESDRELQYKDGRASPPFDEGVK